VVARLRPDIVQTHAVKSHFLARLAGVPERARWVAFHHGYTWPNLRARLYNQFDRWSLRTPGLILTVSQPFREELAARGAPRERIEVIHNAIRPGWGAERRPELRDALGIPAQRKLILIVGRLSREKDHLALLEAVAALAGHDPHLLIVGEGPERARIEARAAALALGGRVTLTGQAPSAEPYYGIADLAVLSSRSEGSPNALLEAMAAGVPAVATNVGGIPEIVTHGEHALLVPPGDSAALAAAMDRVLGDPDLAAGLARRARKHVLARHTPEARIAALAAIYRRLLDPARPAGATSLP
jgi:glycosyltransferase involved in cell wall biosynthesis